jgi:hypothetical protein
MIAFNNKKIHLNKIDANIRIQKLGNVFLCSTNVCQLVAYLVLSIPLYHSS